MSASATKRRFAEARAIDISEQAAEHFNDPATAGKLFVPDAAPRARDGTSYDNKIQPLYDTLEEAFPDVDPLEWPAGNMVLFQIRQVPGRTRGGILLTTESRRAEYDNTQIAKVVRVGPLAFHNRTTNEEWPEGAWVKPGDFVRIPKYQGSRFTRPYLRAERETDPRTGEPRQVHETDHVHFALLKDLAVESTTDQPMTIQAYY